jgi:threonine/homoserine/homoserine lactone efflux protein
MFGIQNLSLFVISCILLNLTPGQDTLFIIGRSIAQGKKAGLLSVMGIMSGVLIHTSLAAFGLSAILATSAWAFDTIKTIGALYLIWIGIKFIKKKEDITSADTHAGANLKPWMIYRQGVLTNVLNPKVSLFFLSFLPQFVAPQTEFIFLPFLLLGLIFFTTGSIWCLILVGGAARLRRWLIKDRSFTGRVLNRATGILFIGLGLKLAMAQAR